MCGWQCNDRFCRGTHRVRQRRHVLTECKKVALPQAIHQLDDLAGIRQRRPIIKRKAEWDCRLLYVSTRHSNREYLRQFRAVRRQRVVRGWQRFRRIAEQHPGGGIDYAVRFNRSHRRWNSTTAWRVASVYRGRRWIGEVGQVVNGGQVSRACSSLTSGWR